MNDDIRLSYLVKIIQKRLKVLDELLEKYLNAFDEEHYEKYSKEKEFNEDMLKLLLDDNHLLNEYYGGF